jgi:hypothetical protein
LARRLPRSRWTTHPTTSSSVPDLPSKPIFNCFSLSIRNGHGRITCEAPLRHCVLRRRISKCGLIFFRALAPHPCC